MTHQAVWLAFFLAHNIITPGVECGGATLEKWSSQSNENEIIVLWHQKFNFMPFVNFF